MTTQTYDDLPEQRWLDDGGFCPPDQAPELLSLNSNTPAIVPTRTSSVYPVLSAHQLTEMNWDFHDLAEFAHEWWDRFNTQFALDIPKTALRFEWKLNRNCLGYFNKSHNEFGLVNEVAIIVRPHLLAAKILAIKDEMTLRRSALDCLNKGEFLGSVLHEQLHFHQELHGLPARGNYHNEQFRRHATTLGLIVTIEGFQGYQDQGPFQDLLDAYGIDPPAPLLDGDQPTKKCVPAGTAKLKKWSCSCNPPVNARVAVSDFQAKCMKCQQMFARAN